MLGEGDVRRGAPSRFNLMSIDSHCHLDCIDPAAWGDVAAILEQARENGVTRFLCVCIDIERLPDVLAIAEAYPQVDCSVGLHPCAQDVHEPSEDELVERAAHPKVVAMGETGLDYFRRSGDMQWQQERFRRHIRAARRSQKPLIVHTRAAREDTIRILQEEGAEAVGGVMHCFAEDWITAQAAMDLGFLISFSGILTFKSADELRALARRVPEQALLVETDAPYLAPVPHRGKINQPAFVRHVVEQLAELRGISPEKLDELTTQNYLKLFKPKAAT